MGDGDYREAGGERSRAHAELGDTAFFFFGG
jgi:hypothetical protein